MFIVKNRFIYAPLAVFALAALLGGPAWADELPLYKTIPPASLAELTPADGWPSNEDYRHWTRSSGGSTSNRFSALTQITSDNVSRLEVAWTYHSGDGEGNIQANPVAVGRRLFLPTAGNRIVALDATTGKEIWGYRPPKTGNGLQDIPARRGLIHWAGDGKTAPRLFFSAGNWVYALEPETGAPVTEFGENGRAELPTGGTATGAIWKHVLIVPGFLGDVFGYDVTSGKQLWRFHTLPTGTEFGADTWARVDKGANCWGGMSLDESRGIAYVATGSPKPNYLGPAHLGANLFSDCIIALNAETGERLWHFQEIEHDIWDLDLPTAPNLVTVMHDGRKVDAVAAVSKIGNTLLLDRVTGKPLFPYRLRRAPASKLEGEVTALYQPDLELPERFSKQEYTAADLTDRTDEAADYALTRFKSAQTGFFRPCSEGRPNLLLGIDGGAEWTGACVDADTGRLYVTANHMGWIISVFRNDDPPDDPTAPKTRGQILFETTCALCHGANRRGIGVVPPLRGLRHRLSDDALVKQIRTGKNGMPGFRDLSEPDLKALTDFLMLRDRPLPPAPTKPERPKYSFGGYPKFYDNEGYPANKPPWGTLNCIDLNTGKLLWKVPLGEYPELTAQGVKPTGTENYGGAIVTAGGLVFCAGTRDSKIRAFDKETGAELWSAKLPWVGNAPPATYEVNGRQFVVIAATGGNKLGTPYGDAYVAFALPRGFH